MLWVQQCLFIFNLSEIPMVQRSVCQQKPLWFSCITTTTTTTEKFSFLFCFFLLCNRDGWMIIFLLLLLLLAFLRFLTSSMKRKMVSLILKNLSMSSVSSIRVLPSMTKSNVSAQEVTFDLFAMTSDSLPRAFSAVAFRLHDLRRTGFIERKEVSCCYLLKFRPLFLLRTTRRTCCWRWLCRIFIYGPLIILEVTVCLHLIILVVLFSKSCFQAIARLQHFETFFCYLVEHIFLFSRCCWSALVFIYRWT